MMNDFSSPMEINSSKNKIGIYTKFSDFIFDDNGFGVLKTALMSVLLGGGVIYLFVPDPNRSIINNKWAVFTIGFIVWWVARNLYWQHRRTQIISLVEAGEDATEQIEYLGESYFDSDFEYIYKIKSLDNAIAIDPNSVDAWYKKGMYLHDHHSAIEAFDEVLAIDPKHGMAWFNKGERFTFLGELNKAIEAFDKVLAIDPNYVWAWKKKGRIFYDLGEYNKAIEAFDTSIHILKYNDPQEFLLPSEGYTWYDKALAFDKLGEYNKAIEAFDEAIELIPDFEEAKKTRNLMIKNMSEMSSS